MQLSTVRPPLLKISLKICSNRSALGTKFQQVFKHCSYQLLKLLSHSLVFAPKILLGNENSDRNNKMQLDLLDYLLSVYLHVRKRVCVYQIVAISMESTSHTQTHQVYPALNITESFKSQCKENRIAQIECANNPVEQLFLVQIMFIKSADLCKWLSLD